jgi:hypothetical protein
MLGGMYWKGGTREGRAGRAAGRLRAVGLHADAAVDRQVGLVADRLHAQGPFGLALLRPEQLLGLAGLDNLTHSLFWSLLANVGLYVGCRWRARRRPREASQALLFVDVFDRRRPARAGVLARPRQGGRPAGAGGALPGRRRARAAVRGYARARRGQRRRHRARRAAGAVRRDAAGRRHRQRLGAGDGGLGGGGGAAGPGRRAAHPRRGLAAARLFAGAGARHRRAARRQRAAGRAWTG